MAVLGFSNSIESDPFGLFPAVKALQLAAQQGQKIFQITPTNATTVLPQLNISTLAKNEIIQGLNAGQHVIAHENQITVPGFTGEGYIIYSPVDGNGAILLFLLGVVLAVLAMFIIPNVAIALAFALVAFVITYLAETLAIIDIISNIQASYEELSGACTGIGDLWGWILAGIFVFITAALSYFLLPILAGLIFGAIMSNLLKELSKRIAIVCRAN